MTLEQDAPTPTGWTSTELADIRTGLEESVLRLRHEVAVADGSVHDAAADHDLADDLDQASHRIELLQDSASAENSAAILDQTLRVIQRLDDGLYGRCEQCSGQIGRLRMEAFPRASYCISCLS